MASILKRYCLYVNPAPVHQILSSFKVTAFVTHLKEFLLLYFDFCPASADERSANILTICQVPLHSHARNVASDNTAAGSCCLISKTVLTLGIGFPMWFTGFYTAENLNWKGKTSTQSLEQVHVWASCFLQFGAEMLPHMAKVKCHRKVLTRDLKVLLLLVTGQQWISLLVWWARMFTPMDAHPKSSEANRKITVEQRSTMSFITANLI